MKRRARRRRQVHIQYRGRANRVGRKAIRMAGKAPNRTLPRWFREKIPMRHVITATLHEATFGGVPIVGLRSVEYPVERAARPSLPTGHTTGTMKKPEAP